MLCAGLNNNRKVFKALNVEKDSAEVAESFSSSSGGGLYIHIPFCRKKCIYCDFYSVGERIADWHGYVDALMEELYIRIAELPKPLLTIYIGGGTPSLMPSEEFLRLCEAIQPYSGMVEEFTIEVNPDDVTPGRLEVWKRGGVNRLSMGIQSFDDHLLNSIRRRHTAKSAIEAYESARKEFGNISIDLIYGLPGQTAEMWMSDVRQAVAMRPEHISAYSLMYEPGTALTILKERGVVSETPEDVSENMMNILISQLAKAGYGHYEISNFALPGFRSRHNFSYWQGAPYLGLGPSAHSYDGLRCRCANKSDIRTYIRHWTMDIPREGVKEDVIVHEYLSEEELREEYVMTRLRTKEGIDLSDYRCRFGETAYKKLLQQAASFIREGDLSISEKHLSLSESAIIISDAIIIALV